MSNKKLPKAIKPEEFKELIKRIPPNKKEVRVAFLLAYASGLRLSEVKNLTPENIKETHIEIWEGKGGKDRTVPKPKGWKEDYTKQLPIKCSTRTLQRYFDRAKEKAGLPDYYTFHSLRHGFGTGLIERGVPLSHVQTLMGHSDISTTGIYLRARPQDALKSYEELW